MGPDSLPLFSVIDTSGRSIADVLDCIRKENTLLCLL